MYNNVKSAILNGRYTELALGKDFNRQAFNDFVIGQGLLPPEQLAEAVRTQFIPSHNNK